MLSKSEVAISEAWSAVGRAYDHYGALRLAVSGGADSLAMLVGLVRLRDAGLMDVELEVLTVDHGLRPGSADEVKVVAGISSELGVVCHVTQLTPPNDIKNKQAWARRERYRALAGLGDAAGAPILTAHTADDQGETFLMRAARGTGSEGLAGIRSPATIAGARIYRPFLNWRCQELRAALRGTSWQPAQDPSNQDEAYTRVRFRRWLADAPVPDSGRSIVQGLTETAQIAELESTALNYYAHELVAFVGGAGRGFVDGILDFEKQPRAVQARFLRSVLAMIARVDPLQPLALNTSFDLARMLKLAEQVEKEPKGRWVGGGGVLDWRHRNSSDARGIHLTAYAEAGRTGFPQIEVVAGTTAAWDHRFHIDNRSKNAITVRAWKASDGFGIADPTVAPLGLSKQVLASLPVVVQGGNVTVWVDHSDSAAISQPGLPRITFVQRTLPS